MDYQGKLYGKMGNKYFDTSKNTAHWDNMVKVLEEVLKDFNDRGIMHHPLKQDVKKAINNAK